MAMNGVGIGTGAEIATVHQPIERWCCANHPKLCCRNCFGECLFALRVLCAHRCTRCTRSFNPTNRLNNLKVQHNCGEAASLWCAHKGAYNVSSAALFGWNARQQQLGVCIQIRGQASPSLLPLNWQSDISPCIFTMFRRIFRIFSVPICFFCLVFYSFALSTQSSFLLGVPHAFFGHLLLEHISVCTPLNGTKTVH